MRHFVIFFFLFFSSLKGAEPQEPPLAIEALIPLYTGSLLATEALNVPVGTFIYQGLVFHTFRYGAYNSHYSLEKRELLQIFNPVFLVETGITPWMDTEITFQGFYKNQESRSTWSVGDPSFLLGFQLYRNKNIPLYIRLIIAEIFPVGKFDHLEENKKGTDQSSLGSFQTQIGLNLAHVFSAKPYPIRWKINLGYTYPSSVRVRGRNAFGGDDKTEATVYPGQSLLFLFSPQIAFSKHWIFTFDLTYTHVFSGSFSGKNTENLNIRSSDSLAFAPAIEYGINKNWGVLAGAWVSLVGRRSPAFAGYSISFVAFF